MVSELKSKYMYSNIFMKPLSLIDKWLINVNTTYKLTGKNYFSKLYKENTK